MFKTIAVYSLPEGADPDKFWKYHREVHAPDVKKGFDKSLKRYVIHRITKMIAGKPSFYGFVETWYDSEEAFNRAFKRANESVKTPEGKTAHEDFRSHVTDFFWAIVDEEVIVP